MLPLCCPLKRRRRAMPKILYVCTSNTCRSPAAATIARAHLEKIGRTDVQIASRGLTDRYSAWGSPPDPRAEKALESATGLSSQGHASSKLTAAEVDGCGALFYFMREHIEWIAGCVGKAPVKRALESGRLRIVQPPDGIPDPFFADDAFYGEVMTMLQTHVARSLDEVLASIHAFEVYRKAQEGKARLTTR